MFSLLSGNVMFLCFDVFDCFGNDLVTLGFVSVALYVVIFR